MRMPLAQRLKYTAGHYLPFLKIAPPLDRQVVFNLRPIRNSAVEWEAGEAGEALLTVPRRTDKIGRAVNFWFRLPETRKVQLDEVGSYVWGLCDGSNTVEAIVKQTCHQYKMNRREVEISVTTYLQMLAERNFIGFFKRGGKTK